VLSLVSGVLMGSFYPLVEMSRAGEIGLGPYTAAVMFAIGVVITTFVFNLYFMNLPVEGEPVAFGDYFRGGIKNHFLGLAGGIVWCSGAIANFTASSAPPEVNVSPAMSYALGQGATMISALWGLLVWKEFAGANSYVKMLLTIMIVLFLFGLGMVSVAPLFGT
jgi:glucose uptake protein